MPSAKQIAWRKKFARMSKAGKFKKSRDTSTTATPRASKRIIGKEFKKLSHLRRTGYDVKTKADYEKLKKQMKY